MQKQDFEPFKVGTVFNTLKNHPRGAKRVHTRVVIKYPSRLEAMAIDPSKIAENNNLRYTPGQIDFTVKLFKTVTVKIINKTDSVKISNSAKRPTLIKHAFLLMKEAIGFKEGLYIDVKDEVGLKHCGLGSSSGLIASVACAINELFGNPIARQDLVKYLAQNHGEEIDGDSEMINPVQCIGGSAACGNYEGSLIILAGESVVVKTMNISDEYDVVIGIPVGFTYPDSKYLMDEEIKNLDNFLECGRKYGYIIAYRLFHECLPDIEEGSLRAVGNLIFDYRYKMGSIKNCSFVYPPIVNIANSVAYLKEKNLADILTISSVGPGMFVITKNTKICEDAFRASGMKTLRTKIHNGRYEVLERQ